MSVRQRATVWRGGLEARGRNDPTAGGAAPARPSRDRVQSARSAESVDSPSWQSTEAPRPAPCCAVSYSPAAGFRDWSRGRRSSTATPCLQEFTRASDQGWSFGGSSSGKARNARNDPEGADGGFRRIAAETLTRAPGTASWRRCAIPKATIASTRRDRARRHRPCLGRTRRPRRDGQGAPDRHAHQQRRRRLARRVRSLHVRLGALALRDQRHGTLSDDARHPAGDAP